MQQRVHGNAANVTFASANPNPNPNPNLRGSCAAPPKHFDFSRTFFAGFSTLDSGRTSHVRRRRTEVAGGLNFAPSLGPCTSSTADRSPRRADLRSWCASPPKHFDFFRLFFAGFSTLDSGRTSHVRRRRTEVAGGLNFAPSLGSCTPSTADRSARRADLRGLCAAPPKHFDFSRTFFAGFSTLDSRRTSHVRRRRTEVAGGLNFAPSLGPCTSSTADRSPRRADLRSWCASPPKHFDFFRLFFAGFSTLDSGRTSHVRRRRTEVAGGLNFAPSLGSCTPSTADQSARRADLRGSCASPSKHFDRRRPVSAGVRSFCPGGGVLDEV